MRAGGDQANGHYAILHALQLTLRYSANMHIDRKQGMLVASSHMSWVCTAGES